MRAVKNENNDYFSLLTCLATSVVFKTWLVASGRVPFNADEAVVALMAKHILQGERPVFFYGQAYMGSLDAWLVALGFALFGEEVWVIRAVQTLLYTATIVTMFWLALRIFHSKTSAHMAAWLMAIPPVNMMLYTTASLGGYGEALLLGNLLLLWGLRLEERVDDPGQTIAWWEWSVLGALAGFGLWVFGITLLYVIPVVIRLTLRLYKRSLDHPMANSMGTAQGIRILSLFMFRSWIVPVVATLFGFTLGASPWMYFATTHGMNALIGELFGGAISGVESGSWFVRTGIHLVSFFLLGVPVILGFRPPWEVRWLLLPLLPFVFMFWLFMTSFVLRERQMLLKNGAKGTLLFGLLLTGFLGFIFTPYGADPSGRYFLPLYIPLALLAASFLNYFFDRNKTAGILIGALLLSYHAGGILQCAFRNPPGLTTQFYAPSRIDHRYDEELIRFLEEVGETRGYTNYWVAYPLAFLSDEQLIFVPRLPYHPDFRYTERDDRYPPYDQIVAQADRVAYIVTHHPKLEQKLRQWFCMLGIAWKEAQIGDYHLFYQLSRAVRPEDLGLGSSWP